MSSRKRIAPSLAGAVLLFAAGCDYRGAHLADDLARQTMSKYAKHDHFLVSGNGKEGSASLNLGPDDARNECPWGDIELTPPKGFFPGEPAHQQFGCTEAQSGPLKFSGDVDGVRCDILPLPAEKQYVVLVFCGL